MKFQSAPGSPVPLTACAFRLGTQGCENTLRSAGYERALSLSANAVERLFGRHSRQGNSFFQPERLASLTGSHGHGL